MISFAMTSCVLIFLMVRQSSSEEMIAYPEQHPGSVFFLLFAKKITIFSVGVQKYFARGNKKNPDLQQAKKRKRDFLLTFGWNFCMSRWLTKNDSSQIDSFVKSFRRDDAGSFFNLS